jgi:hypothetical protein
MNNQLVKRVGLLLGAVAALALMPLSGRAQQPVDSRWLPWLGCWQADASADTTAPTILVCVRPASAAEVVEVATFRGGELVSSRTLVADGQTHPLRDESCSGTQLTRFSSDGRRVYLRSAVTCEGGLERTASAVMGLTSSGEWLDAQALGVRGRRVPRMIRYRPAPDATWPAGFAPEAPRAQAVAEARVLASGKLTLEDVQDAAATVDREALVALVLEWGRPFDLTGAKLAALADAGIPADVIDAIVAVSYPTRFVVDRTAQSLALAPTPEAARQHWGRNIYADPYGWGWWGYDQCYAGLYWSSYCGSSLYWMSAYGYGGYLPYWSNPYGYAYWGQPIIVVTGNNGQSTNGTAVRGRGYTRGGTAGGGRSTGTAHPRGGTATQDRSGGGSYSPSAPSTRSSSGGGSASPGGYSRSGSSSGSSQGSAKPKCCS